MLPAPGRGSQRGLLWAVEPPFGAFERRELHSIAAADTRANRAVQHSDGGDPRSDLVFPSLTSAFFFLTPGATRSFFLGKLQKERMGGALRRQMLVNTPENNVSFFFHCLHIENREHPLPVFYVSFLDTVRGA